MTKKKTSILYKFIKWAVDLVYPAMEIVGAENLPEEPCVIVGNHSQLHGPIACELRLPVERYTWCAGEMMVLREVPAYAFQDFWGQKPKRSQWLYKIVSYLIAPLSVCIFNNANTIAVRHDSRVLSTFRDSIAKLKAGSSIVIFPEHDVKYNHIVYDFQENFVDLARMYHRKTGEELCFVPMYLAPKLKKIVFGKPQRFSAAAPIKEERGRICAAMKEEITALAQALPRHRVIPYRNIPKKDYPYNICEEVSRK